jgi:hypothetical protein
VLVFLTPKAFRGPDADIQRLVIASWQATGARVVMFGEGENVAEAAADLGVDHRPAVESRPDRRPLLSDMFGQAYDLADGDPLVYVNADIFLLGPAGLAESLALLDGFGPFLGVARRWELRVDPAETGSLGRETLADRLASGLRRGPDEAIDLFVLRGLAPRLPPFAVGRVGWDNWMIYDALERRIPVVDLSQNLTLVHLDVDPGWTEGKRAPQDPETERNRRLAGWGQLLTLQNATHRIVDGELRAVRRRSAATYLRSKVGSSGSSRALLRAGRWMRRTSRRLRTGELPEDRFAWTYFAPPERAISDPARRG